MKSNIIHFLDPNSKVNGTKYRSVACDKRAIYLEHEVQKKKPQRKCGPLDTIKLGVDYSADTQSYYTRDIKKVTCKNCKRNLGILKKKKKVARWEAKFIGTTKAGGWLVMEDGVVRKMFPGSGRKNHEVALAIVVAGNKKANEAKHENV